MEIIAALLVVSARWPDPAGEKGMEIGS